MLKLADRLILSVMLPRLATVVGAGVALYASVELIDLANFAGSPSAWRYPLRLPFALALVSPVAALVVGAWTVTRLVRTGQLTALSAAGRGTRRALAPLLVMGGLWSAAVWVVAGYVAPVGLASWRGPAATQTGGSWTRSGEALVRADRAGADRAVGVLIFLLDERGQPQSRIEAESARLEEGRWVLHDVRVLPEGEGARQLDELPSPVPLVGSGSRTAPQELTSCELVEAARLAAISGADDAPLRSESALRLALALACLVCMALGAGVGVIWAGRTGVVSMITAASGLVYWMSLAVCWTLANAGLLAPWVVVVVPFVALSSVAIAMWWRLFR